MSNAAKIEDVKLVPKSTVKCYADVAWDPSLNVRKDYGSAEDDRKTRDLLATPIGWDHQYPAIAEAVNEDELARHMERRKAAHALLKRLCDDDALSEDEKKARDKEVTIQRNGSNHRVKGREWAMARLAVFEYAYCTPSGGYKKPKVTGTTGNRRGSQVVDAMASQLINAQLDAGDPKLQPSDDNVTTHISVIVPDGGRFADSAVRMQMQIRENTTKTAGFKPMTAAEDLTAVLVLTRDFGKSQTDVRNSGYGATYGLRLYFACIIHIYCELMSKDHTLSKEDREAWAAVDLVGRLCEPKFTDTEAQVVNPRHLDWKAFNQKAFQGDEKAGYVPMGLMCETDSKFEKENRRRAGLKDPKPEMERPTVEVVLDWITKVSTEGGPKTKPTLKRETIQGLASRSPNPFTRQAMLAVDRNDDTLLKRNNERADVASYVFQIDDDVYEVLAEAAGLLDSLDDAVQITLLQQLIENAKSAIAADTSDAGEEETEVVS